MMMISLSLRWTSRANNIFCLSKNSKFLVELSLLVNYWSERNIKVECMHSKLVFEVVNRWFNYFTFFRWDHEIRWGIFESYTFNSNFSWIENRSCTLQNDSRNSWFLWILRFWSLLKIQRFDIWPPNWVMEICTIAGIWHPLYCLSKYMTLVGYKNLKKFVDNCIIKIMRGNSF